MSVITKKRNNALLTRQILTTTSVKRLPVRSISKSTKRINISHIKKSK